MTMVPRYTTNNIREQRVALELEKRGWDVYRDGWPDFIAERDGELRFIEVKNYNESRTRVDRLSVRQKRVRRLLAGIGINVEVIEVDADGQPRDRATRARNLFSWDEVIVQRKHT